MISGPPLAEEDGLGSLTLCGFLEESAARFPDNEAVAYRNAAGVDERWSYADLYQNSVRVARALLACGISKDTRVGVLMTNRPEWLFAIFGAALAGAVGVAMSTFSTRRELEHELRIADVEILLMEGTVLSHDFVAELASLCPALETSKPGDAMVKEFPYLRRVVVVGDPRHLQAAETWDDFLAHSESVPADIATATSAAVSPVDIGLVFFSSGTTAMPKAILHRHRAAALQCWRFGKWYETDSSVRCWSANGFFWSGNFGMALGSTLSVGGCVVLQGTFDPDEAIDILQRERVSLAIAWPHQEARLRECSGWESADFSSLTYVDAETSVFAMHPSVTTRWRQPTAYGTTETFTFVTGLRGRDAPPGSNGVPLPGVTLAIVDPESGAIMQWGEIGEIIVKGPTLTPGYLKVDPEKTFDNEGFFHSGDAGYLRDDGHLCWEGRLSDIIKTGGANVSPTEIDAILSEHPDVQASFTVGVPHDTLGELVVACVIPRPGRQLDEDRVKAHAKRSLASFKVPRKVMFFTDSELPMTGSHKIQRGDLRKLVMTRLEHVANQGDSGLRQVPGS